ncbi:MAG: hypothetical protein HOF35_07050 [Bacteroidetes bacterium]|jgi:hypothetical protein|nr:hypothetical protein [Bacteroidota bacterium]
MSILVGPGFKTVVFCIGDDEMLEIFERPLVIADKFIHELVKINNSKEHIYIDPPFIPTIHVV